MKSERVGDLNPGDIFITKFKYALRDTPERCDTFAVISQCNKRTKCLASNFWYQQMFYFSKKLKVNIIGYDK